MHIGVDATCWLNQRGYGRHARSLLTALVGLDRKNRYSFVVDSHEDLAGVPDNVEIRRVQSRAPTVKAASADGRRSLVDMWRMSRAMSERSFDLVLFPTVYSFVPVLSRAKKVLMIHDVIAEKFPELTLPSRAGRWFWKLKVALGRRQADAVVTVSEHSRQGIADHFGMSPDRLYVVGEASDPVFRVVTDGARPERFQSSALDEKRHWIVYVGGFGPHKNLPMLVDVFAQLVRDSSANNVQLILVGDYRGEAFYSRYADLKRQVESLGLADRVIFPGFVSDEDLVWLLNRAVALVLPSLLEGFGLPAVEAAACGCPVVATTESPLPRLLGDGGIFVSPHDPAGWQEALSRVVKSAELRASMRAAGLAAAARLTWPAAASQMLAVLEGLAA